MDERVRRDHELEALERIAEELERLRLLREHELGARVVDVEGTLVVRPNAERRARRTNAAGALHGEPRPLYCLRATSPIAR